MRHNTDPYLELPKHGGTPNWIVHYGKPENKTDYSSSWGYPHDLGNH
jgi:hypothetical protein